MFLCFEKIFIMFIQIYEKNMDVSIFLYTTIDHTLLMKTKTTASTPVFVAMSELWFVYFLYTYSSGL